VAFKLIPKDKLRLVAADIAETILHIYESKYPGDLRPRKAIEAARKGDRNAYAAARAATDAAANAAAAGGRAKQEKVIRTILIKYLGAI
jgi:hypothetical protein